VHLSDTDSVFSINRIKHITRMIASSRHPLLRHVNSLGAVEH
jgi:hypothetical protein